MTENTKKREIERNIVNKIAEPFVNFFIKCRIGPNTLTFFGLISACIAAFFIATGFVYNYWFWWTIPVAILMCGFFDVMDGAVARKTKKDSPAGAFLDSMLDRISDFVIIFGMVFGGLISWIVGYFLFFIILMISYSRSKAENENIDMTGIGLMERAERLLYLIGTFTIVSLLYNLLQITNFLVFCLIMYSIFLFLTLFHRFSYAYGQLKKKDWHGPFESIDGPILEYDDVIPIEQNPFITDKEREEYKQKIIEKTKNNSED